MHEQIAHTLKQFPSVGEVSIAIEGNRGGAGAIEVVSRPNINPDP
jgi:hypothetical protein